MFVWLYFFRVTYDIVNFIYIELYYFRLNLYRLAYLFEKAVYMIELILMDNRTDLYFSYC